MMTAVVAFLDRVELFRFRFAQPFRQQHVVESEGQRRKRHRQRDHDHQRIGQRASHDAVVGGQAEQHEGEFAALAQGNGESARRFPVVSREPAEAEQDRCLDGHQCDGRADDRERVGEDQAEVGGHAHRDEEQPEQQALERFDVGFEFVAVFGVRKQHAGEEGAQRHRQADRTHQQGSADHHQQRRRGEDFLDAACRNGVEHRA